MTSDVNRTMGVVGTDVLASGKYASAALYMQGAGFDKLVSTVKRMGKAQLLAAWRTWVDAVAAERRRRARAAYLRKHGAATMWQRIVEATRRMVRAKFGTWRSFVFALRQAEHAEANEAAAATIGAGLVI